MSSDHKILEKIDLYAKGIMGEEERAEFERELEANPQLQRQLQLSMIVDQMVVAKEALALKEQMKKDLYKPKYKFGRYLGASLILLSIGGGIWYTNQKQDTVFKPQASHVPSTRGGVPKDTTKYTYKHNVKEGVAPKPVPKVVAKPSVTLSQKEHEKSMSSTPPEAFEQHLPTAPALEEPQKAPAITHKEVDHCAGLQPFVEFSVIPSCKGEATGEIYINATTVKGGSAPYHFIIGDVESPSHFAQLHSGYYTLQIKDARNCMVQNRQPVYIPEKLCKETSTHVFHMTYDQSWLIPYDKDKVPASVRIVDQNGKLFYHSHVMSGSPEEWRGESNTGLELRVGLYFYSIEYIDKSIDEGSITIIK